MAVNDNPKEWITMKKLTFMLTVLAAGALTLLVATALATSANLSVQATSLPTNCKAKLHLHVSYNRNDSWLFVQNKVATVQVRQQGNSTWNNVATPGWTGNDDVYYEHGFFYLGVPNEFRVHVTGTLFGNPYTLDSNVVAVAWDQPAVPDLNLCP